MTDILITARRLSEQGDYYSPQWREAADEIERLRGENRYLQKIITEYQYAMGWFEAARAALGEKE